MLLRYWTKLRGPGSKDTYANKSILEMYPWRNYYPCWWVQAQGNSKQDALKTVQRVVKQNIGQRAGNFYLNK
ncbi:hypothetical protein ANTQUA_LOCUS1183 [Anthophora quadrimaculata]